MYINTEEYYHREFLQAQDNLQLTLSYFELIKHDMWKLLGDTEIFIIKYAIM